MTERPAADDAPPIAPPLCEFVTVDASRLKQLEMLERIDKQLVAAYRASDHNAQERGLAALNRIID